MKTLSTNELVENRTVNIIIFSVFAYILYSLVFGQLLNDELYFLRCAYDLANNATLSFDLSELCYTSSIYELILIPFLKEPYWVQGVIVFKYLNYFLILSLPFLYCAVASKQSFFNQKISTVLLTCTLILYMGSQRNIEIRPDSFAAIALFFGAIFLITPQQTNIRKYYISATLLLLSAYLTSRIAPFSVLILMYGIASLYNEHNHIKNKRNHIIALCIVLIAIIYNMVDFWLNVNPYDASITISLELTEHIKKNLFLELVSIAHFIHPIVKWFFLTIRVLSIVITLTVSLYLFVQILRKKIKKETILLLALPFAWIIILLFVNKSPYGYIMIVEGAILSIFWITVFQQKLVSYKFNFSPKSEKLFYFLYFILMISVISAHFSVVNLYRKIDYISTFNEDTVKHASNDVLIATLRKNNIKDQLIARKSICTRYPNVATLFNNPSLLICKENFKNFNVFRANQFNSNILTEFMRQPILIIDSDITGIFRNFDATGLVPVTTENSIRYYTRGIYLNNYNNTN